MTLTTFLVLKGLNGGHSCTHPLTHFRYYLLFINLFCNDEILVSNEIQKM